MPIKFVALRSHDGHATDPTRPLSKVRAGVGGDFEILATDKADSFRVSVDGIQLTGKPAKWPSDKKPGKSKVLIEQIVADAVVHTVHGEVEVVGPKTETIAVSTPAETKPTDPPEETEAE